MGRIGKTIHGTTYAHSSALPFLPARTKETVTSAANVAPCDIDWNVIKVDSSPVVSFLLYEDFDVAAFPSLLRSVRIDPRSGTLIVRDFSQSRNPPILHRKELLVAPDHPRVDDWKRLTDRLEAIGAFERSHLIGRRLQWAERLKIKGFVVDGAEIRSIRESEENDGH